MASVRLPAYSSILANAIRAGTSEGAALTTERRRWRARSAWFSRRSSSARARSAWKKRASAVFAAIQIGDVGGGCPNHGEEALARPIGMVFAAIQFSQGKIRVEEAGIRGFRGHPRFAGRGGVAGATMSFAQEVIV